MASKKLVFKNVAVSGITRLIILVLSIVMPRLLITSFGSEVNGLLSAVTQIFSYLALLEAGIGTSTSNALYSPLVKSDRQQVNEVVTESQRYYRKVSIVYGLCILAFAVIYPLVAKTEVSRLLIFEIILLQGASNFLYYYFCAVYEQLLIADGRKYVLENIHFASYVLQTLGKIVLIYLGFSVLVVQIMGLLMTLIRIPILKLYARKKYPWLNRNTDPTKHYLKERKAFVVHQLSGIIFHNTGVFLVSTFCGFALTSVYTVYMMIFSSLDNLLNSTNAGLSFVLGQNLDKDKRELRRIYDMYNSLYIAVCFALFTVAGLLTRPFMSLYTAGVTDISYLMPGLPLLFVINNLMSNVRMIAARLITVGGHADKTKTRSLIEAGINIVASLIFIYFFDIYGVVLGAVTALMYRCNDIIIYTNIKILERSPLHDYLGILAHSAAAVLLYQLFEWWQPVLTDYVSLFLNAIPLTLFACALFLVVALATNWTAFRPFLKSMKQKVFHKSA